MPTMIAIDLRLRLVGYSILLIPGLLHCHNIMSYERFYYVVKWPPFLRLATRVLIDVFSMSSCMSYLRKSKRIKADR